MDARQIVEELARQHVVEDIVQRVCHSEAAEMSDLSQYVYELMLRYREDCIVDLWKNGREQMEAFIVRLVMTNYYMPHSRFFRLFRQYGIRHPSTDAERRQCEKEKGAAD